MNTHQQRMERCREGIFVHHDTIGVAPMAGWFRMGGEIACLGNLVIAVEKAIRVVADDGVDQMVQTHRYAYNLSVRGYSTVFRYDNRHPHPGHHDAHHFHDRDWKQNKDLPGSPRWVGEYGWPTLGKFIDLCEDWYWKNRDELPHPDDVVETLQTYVVDC